MKNLLRSQSIAPLLMLMYAGDLCSIMIPIVASFPPYRVIGNVYYVGSRGLASYLITTPQGNILINSSLEASVPLIRNSIEKLGFKFKDTKILLISHAHWDHCAGSEAIKELTGAKYMVMDADVPEIEAGGKFPIWRQPRITLPAHESGPRATRWRRGETRRHRPGAHLTPGHTREQLLGR